MDTVKIGKFLKELRNGKSLTQEQLAERLYVSGRTVSRWETGANLPDISIIIELSDFYNVDIREILDGGRKGINMEKEFEHEQSQDETILKVAEYSQEEKKIMLRGGRRLFTVGMIVSVANLIVERTDFAAGSFWPNFSEFVSGFNDGFVFMVMLIGILYTTNRLKKLQGIKQRLFKKQ